MRLAPLLVTLAIVTVLSGCVSTATETAPSPTATPGTPSSIPTVSATATPTFAPTPDPAAFTPVDPALFFVNDLQNNPGGTWDTQDVNFVSPSGNLACAILGPENNYLWGCTIGEQNWQFPNASPSDYCYQSEISCGRGIEVTGEELPHPRKRSDPGYPAAFALSTMDFPIRVLEYGESVTFANVTCFSEPTAVTCQNAVSKHGFIISRDQNDIY